MWSSDLVNTLAPREVDDDTLDDACSSIAPISWSIPEAELIGLLETSSVGLSSTAAALRRTKRKSTSVHGAPPRMSDWRLFVRQVESPIVLLLIGATMLSMALGEVLDGVIILIITATSAALGFVQERGAMRAVEDLLARVRVHADVLRDGVSTEVALDDVVVGDVMVLRAGDVIAADSRVLSSDSLLLDESSLTGESLPAEKQAGLSAVDSPFNQRTNAVWCGTNVASGTGTAVVLAVGVETEFGRIGNRLSQAHVPTSFELGLRRFGFMIMRVAGVLVTAVFGINVILKRPVLESFLFSLALAVGLTPQMLPAIVTVTLSRGARKLVKRKVIVKRLDAIEDIGSIQVLCTDKTGTLTEGAVTLDATFDETGQPSETVRELAWINAWLQRGFINPVDSAILKTARPPLADRTSLIDEFPYDFTRRRLSILVEHNGEYLLITKGSVSTVLTQCDLDPGRASKLQTQFESLSASGYRVLAVASKQVLTPTSTLSEADETHLQFVGFLCFADPPKRDAAAAIADLASLGVVTKMITGDNRYAAAHLAAAVGLDASNIVDGEQIRTADDQQLIELATKASVFAQVEPLQKERIVAALRRSGLTVGYLGDGINDAPSLRTADVGISVDSAVDVAKHSASVVLLEKDLAVLAEGIRQGRQVFANTLKYVQVTMSANFGNMVSMAVAAAVLPFLPMLPRQILLLNFLSDIPAMTVAADRVDPESVKDPHGWDLTRLRSFMVVFGLISSAFDLSTFAILRFVLHAGPELFRTGWFIESTATELVVMLVLRTKRRTWKSRPGTALMICSALVLLVTLVLPFSWLRTDLGLARPTSAMFISLGVIALAYILATELAKDMLSGRVAATQPSTLPLRHSDVTRIG